MNFQQLKLDSDTSGSNQERDDFVTHLVSKGFNSKEHIYAHLCDIFDKQGVRPAKPNTDFMDMSSDQRDLVTIYSQVAKGLGFIQ